jgi:3-oxoacyl-[acyl-carrier protein] reductase
MTGALTGKVAIVIGGSRGIGAAIVRRLSADGAKVGFTFLQSGKLATELRGALEATGGEALAVQADSADPAALTDAIRRIAARFGRIDILINNAGIAIAGSIVDYAITDFDRMVITNVRPLLVATQAALPHMPDGGRIVAIGSTTADRTIWAGAAVYAMTKAAVASLVRGMAIDLAPRGITVNTVQPGPTTTDLNPADGARATALAALIPLKRMAQDSEVAGLVAYAVGPEAGFVNGATLTINGGLNA